MTTTTEKLNELKARLRDVADLNSVGAVLHWDQATYMPPGGAAARGRQMAVVGRIAQELFSDLATGRLLDELRPYEESLPYDSDDASLIRVARRDYEKAVKIPPDFLSAFYEHSATSYQVTHNFNTRDVVVEVYRNSGNFDSVLVEVQRTSVNAVTILFDTAPSANAYRVLVRA